MTACSTVEKRVRAQRLSQWTGTLGIEKNCAQVIVSGPHGRGTWKPRVPRPDVQRTVGTMKHEPVTASNSFLGLSGEAMVALAYLHTKYVLQDMPKGGEVVFAVGDLLSAVGRRMRKGTTVVAGILDELQAGSFQGVLSLHTGETVRGELRAIEWYTMHASGVCKVCLPEIVAENLRNDFTAYLDHDTMLELKRANPDAMRLWVYAEAQNLKTSVFAKNGLPACIFPQRWTDKNKTITVNVMLSLAKGSETKALERIHAAVDCVNTIDERYELRVELGKSWVLVLKRGGLGKCPPNPDGGGEPSTEPSTKRSTEPSTSINTHPYTTINTETNTTSSITPTTESPTTQSPTSGSSASGSNERLSYLAPYHQL